MPRQEYFDLIQKYKISDILSLIPDLSFSKKTNIIKNMLDSTYHNYKVVNQTLYYYKEHYIDVNRVQISFLEKTLIGVAKKVIIK